MGRSLREKCGVERLQYASGGILEAGVDEAGRGALAGPVVAAAVILPEDFPVVALRDSKAMTVEERLQWREIICAKAIAWSIGFASPEEIDRHNILQASMLAMHRALDKLNPRPQHVLVDGHYFIPWIFVPYTTVVGGDGRYGNIAAASILAKTYRDEWMCKLHERYPQYRWDENKGYPTNSHRQGIRRHGPSPFHRKSFKLL